jgi:2-polyprenyl-3-methyl-5-hydroxy-6-metoxy-1,4-benzoquinol methylase
LTTFNQAQYDDFCSKPLDLYAQTKYDVLLDYLAGRRGLRILNAGCGSGELSLSLAAAGHTVVGIDPEPRYVELARKNAAARPDLDCKFEVAFIEDYRGGGDFDCAVATDVLEHIEDDRTAFDRLVRQVRPGGLVLITVPAGNWLFGYHDEVLGHYRRYSPRTLRALVEGACTVHELRHFGFSLIPVCFLFSKLLRRPYPIPKEKPAGGRSLGTRVLGWTLQADRRLPMMPVGTSLLLKATRNQPARAVPQAA